MNASLPSVVAAGEAAARELDTLEAQPGMLLRRGSWKKPEVRLLSGSGGAVVMKDWRRMARWLRPWARFIARHEARNYRRLAGVRGIPALVAAFDRVIVLQHLPGERISRFRRHPEAAAAIRSMEAAVRAMHDAGVYHGDLRRRDNILVADDGSVGIVDFSSAVSVRRLGALSWLLRPLLHLLDRYAVLKWKSRLAPAGMTGGERRLLRLLDTLRFWHRDP